MLTATWTFLIWTLAVSTVGSDDPGPYRELGTTVVISAGQATDKVTSITWKHGPDIAAEWFGSSVTCYRHFKDRCQLNTATGDLTIKNVTREDSGYYTAEISNLVKNPIEIQIIAPVPTPTITTRCDNEKTYCVLTCEGDITDTGPVQYSWISGDTVEPGSKTLNITQEQKEAEFGCSLKNPVSQKSSQKVQNPFVKVLETGNPALFALFLLLPILVILIVLYFVFRQRIHERLNLDRWWCCNKNKGGQEERQIEEIVGMLHNTNNENPDMNLQNGEASTPLQTSTWTSETNTGTENPDCNLQSGEAPTSVLIPTGISDTSPETEIEEMLHNTNNEIEEMLHNTNNENPDMDLQNGEASTPLQTSTGTSETNTGTENPDCNLQSGEAPTPVQIPTGISDTSTGTGAVEQDQVQENPGEAPTPVLTPTGTSDTSTETGTPQDSHTCEEDHEQTTANHDGSSETTT